MPNITTTPVALLAGGLATRLRPVTQTIPKALVDLAGAPFVDHQLSLLARNGIRRVVLCLGYLGEQVQAHCGDGARYGMELRYSFDGDQLMGTGGALVRAAAARLLGDMPDAPFWVMYGDSYMDIDYAAVLDRFLASDALGLMTVLRNENRWDRSNVIFRDGQLVRYDKRQTVPEMEHIDYGAALLRRGVIDRLPTDRPADLAVLYSGLVAERSMIGFEVSQRFYEIGTPAALEEARAYLAAMTSRT